jgi:hypothetical protein
MCLCRFRYREKTNHYYLNILAILWTAGADCDQSCVVCIVIVMLVLWLCCSVGVVLWLMFGPTIPSAYM